MWYHLCWTFLMLAFQRLFLDLFPESRRQEIWSGFVIIAYEAGQMRFKCHNYSTRTIHSTNIFTWTRTDSTWPLYSLKVSATATPGSWIPDQVVLDKFDLWGLQQFTFPGHYNIFFSTLHCSLLLVTGCKHWKTRQYLHLDKVLSIQGRLHSTFMKPLL